MTSVVELLLLHLFFYRVHVIFNVLVHNSGVMLRHSCRGVAEHG